MVQDPVSDPQTKDHKHEALCMISMFLGGLSFYIVNGLFHKFPVQLLQLGSRYNNTPPQSGTSWPADQHAGSIISNNSSIVELFGFRFGGPSEDPESPDHQGGPVKKQETTHASGDTPQASKPKDHGGSPGGQEAESDDSAATQTPETEVQKESPAEVQKSDGGNPETSETKGPKGCPAAKQDQSEAATQTKDHKHEALCRISMFLGRLSFYIMYRFIDTETIKGDASDSGSDAKKAIDPGDNEDVRKKEDENKGILELFKIDHAEDWSPISMLTCFLDSLYSYHNS